MKKLFLLLAVVGMLATACENFGIDDPQLPQIEIVGGDEALSLDFSSGGTLSKSITFSCNYDWNVTTSDEWIKVSPESGTAGEECQITISLDENNTYDTRNGKITISIQELSIEVSILQSQKNALLLTHSEVKLPQTGGSFEVAVKSNIEYEYEIKADWIKPIESRALVDNMLRFEAEVNPTADQRTGEIVFEGEGLTGTVVITQSQTNIISLSTSTIEIDGNGGTFSVDVSSNVEYNVVIDEGCDWISQVDSRAVTTSTLNFAVSENKSGTNRIASITVSGEELSERITVNQKYKEPAPQSNEIWYTSTDGAVVTPYKTDAFGANIVSNTYEDGKGVIIFDANVTQIGERAFSNCSSLTNITIPNSVKTIGVLAFGVCGSLTNVEIPDGVTHIEDRAFTSCFGLTTVTIPDSVTYIGTCSFSNCQSLESFYGKYASEDNRCLVVDCVLNSFAPAGLIEYTIPDGVTSIDQNAFWWNGATGKESILKSVTIPESVTSIGRSAFYNCNKLSAFYGKFASQDNRCLIVDGILKAYAPAGLTEYSITNNVTSIGDYVFWDCTSLTNITIPNSVTSIGKWALANTSLTNFTIPDGVISLGEYSFCDCKKLTNGIIPDSVTSIESSAFSHCSNLTSVYCKSITPPICKATTYLGWNAFDYNATGRKIYAPTDSVEAYKAANGWSGYADYIVGYDFD